MCWITTCITLQVETKLVFTAIMMRILKRSKPSKQLRILRNILPLPIRILKMK